MNERTAALPEPSPQIDALAKAVIGAAIEVHRLLGPGFIEPVYYDAMVVELALRGIRFDREFPVAVIYKGHRVGQGFVDLFVRDELVVELKAVESLAPIHTAQTISYLKATGKPLGLLINFNVPLLKDGVKRLVLSPRQST